MCTTIGGHKNVYGWNKLCEHSIDLQSSLSFNPIQEYLMARSDFLGSNSKSPCKTQPRAVSLNNLSMLSFNSALISIKMMHMPKTSRDVADFVG